MMAETSFHSESRRTRMTPRQTRPLSHAALAALAFVLGAVILYPMVVVLWGLFAP